MWFLPRTKIYIRKRRRARRARRSRTETHHYLEHKERARTIVHEKLAFWSTHYTVSYNRVAIKNHSSRWGSCSSKQNLNFNYRVAFLPEPLLDYIIVHELCHLLEFNHSSIFWAHVAKAIPDYEARKTELGAIPASGRLPEG